MEFITPDEPLFDNEDTSTSTMPANQRSITDKIWQENDGNKRINGHDAQYIADSMGIDIDRLFPPEGKSLYIGDPYQKLDRKGVTIVDYEFGPVAEFQYSKKIFLERLEDQYSRSYDFLKYKRSKDYESTEEENFLLKLKPYIDVLVGRSKFDSIEDYTRISHAFTRSKEQVEEEIRRETGEESGDPIGNIDDRVRSLWYLAVQGERIRDIHDFKTFVGPEIHKFEKVLPVELSLEARRKLIWQKRRELVESIRLKKTAKEADVVEAMFPDLPFNDHTFDSVVAYYSISTYVFPSLEYNDFIQYWESLDRVLKPDGRAYIGPLYDCDEKKLYKSIDDFKQEHPGFNVYFDDGMMFIIKTEGLTS